MTVTPAVVPGNYREAANTNLTDQHGVAIGDLHRGDAPYDLQSSGPVDIHRLKARRGNRQLLVELRQSQLLQGLVAVWPGAKSGFSTRKNRWDLRRCPIFRRSGGFSNPT